MFDVIQDQPDADDIRLRYLLNDETWPVEYRDEMTKLRDSIVMGFLWTGADLFVLPNLSATLPTDLWQDLYWLGHHIGKHPEWFSGSWVPITDGVWLLAYGKELVDFGAELRALAG